MSRRNRNIQRGIGHPLIMVKVHKGGKTGEFRIAAFQPNPPEHKDVENITSALYVRKMSDEAGIIQAIRKAAGEVREKVRSSRHDY